MKEKCYVIIFELKHDPSALIAAIKSYGTWAKITENTWAIVTTQTAKEVRDALKEKLQSAERLFVLKSGVEAAWKNAICTTDWLMKNL